jgi:hypothetical protein
MLRCCTKRCRLRTGDAGREGGHIRGNHGAHAALCGLTSAVCVVVLLLLLQWIQPLKHAPRQLACVREVFWCCDHWHYSQAGHDLRF